jgi:hypothetical protein
MNKKPTKTIRRLRSRYSVTAAVYLLIPRSLPSNSRNITFDTAMTYTDTPF